MSIYKVYASEEYVDDKIQISRVQPNWEQSDETAHDYIKGRTHYKTGGSIEWDGNTDGLESVGNYYRVSELTPSLDNLVGAAYSAIDVLEGSDSGNISQDQLHLSEDGSSLYCDIGYGSFYVAMVDNATYGSQVFPKAGIYFYWNYDGNSCFKSLTWGGVVPLDEEYIPSSIQRANSSITIPSGATLAFESGAKVEDEDGALCGVKVMFWMNTDRTIQNVSSDTYAKVLNAIENNRPVTAILYQPAQVAYYDLRYTNVTDNMAITFYYTFLNGSGSIATGIHEWTGLGSIGVIQLKEDGSVIYSDIDITDNHINSLIDAKLADIETNSFSGSYNDLTDKPELFSGSYNDLADKPATEEWTFTLADGSVVTKKVVVVE